MTTRQEIVNNAYDFLDQCQEVRGPMALETRAERNVRSALVAPRDATPSPGEDGTPHSYAAELRAALADRDLPQAALANELEVTRSLVNLWVTGAKIPTFEQALAIERALKIEPPGATTRHLGFIPAPTDRDLEDVASRLRQALPYLDDQQIDALVPVVEQFSETNRRRRRRGPE